MESQQSREWLTDAEVAFDSNSDHDERRERDVARDEELVELAAGIARQVKVDDFHICSERYDNETGDEAVLLWNIRTLKIRVFGLIMFKCDDGSCNWRTLNVPRQVMKSAVASAVMKNVIVDVIWSFLEKTYL